MTGCPSSIAEIELSKHPDGLIDNVVIANSEFGLKEKPDPEGLLVCLDNLGVAPANAMYVGNCADDVEAARRASEYIKKDRKANNDI